MKIGGTRIKVNDVDLPGASSIEVAILRVERQGGHIPITRNPYHVYPRYILVDIELL